MLQQEDLADDGHCRPAAVDVLPHQFGAVCDRRSSDADDPTVDRLGADSTALRAALCRNQPAVDSARTTVPGPPGRLSAGRHLGTGLSTGADRQPGPPLVCGAGFRSDAVGSLHLLAESEAAVYGKWAARTVV